MGGVVFALTAACSGKPDRACEPGRQVACACPGGAAGAQACLESGQGFARCECAVPPAPTVAPDAAGAASDPVDAAPPRAPAADLVKCPADAIALAASLTPVSDDDDDEVELEPSRCTPGLFPDPGWAIAFQRGSLYHRVVVDAKQRRVVARAEPERVGSHIQFLERLATIDFDDDGSSELLHVVTDLTQGMTTEKLMVFRRDGDRLDTALDIVIGGDNSGADPDPGDEYSNTATYEVTKEVDGTRGIRIEDQMVDGKPTGEVALYRWSQGQLVLQP